MRGDLCGMSTAVILAASGATAQSATISVEAPERVSPGERFVVRVLADVEVMPEQGAIAGYGFDVLVSGAFASVESADPLGFGAGSIAGTPGPSGLIDVVGGQNANVLNTNPSILMGSQQTLFEFEIVAAGDGQITINPANPNPNGGLLIYTNAETGENIAIDPGFIAAVVQVSDVCLADVNMNGSVEPTDFGAWLAAYNSDDPAADQNQNGTVEPTDFGAWLTNYNAGCD